MEKKRRRRAGEQGRCSSAQVHDAAAGAPRLGATDGAAGGAPVGGHGGFSGRGLAGAAMAGERRRRRSGLRAAKKEETIPCVPLKKITMSCVSLKKFSGLQRHCYNFFVPSMPLSSVWALTPSSCRCEKSKIRTLMSKYVIKFF